MLSLDQVQSFIALAEQKSFRKAADELECSQPTISQRLKRLENSLGTTLINRQQTECSLTEAGRRFLPLAYSMMNLAADAKALVRSRNVRIAASSNIGIYSLPRALAMGHPNLGQDEKIELWLGTNPDVYERLLRHEADIAIMEWWQSSDGYRASVIAEDPLVLITPMDHPLAEQAAVSVAELYDLAFIGGEPGTGTGRILRRVFGRKAGRLKTGAVLGSTEAVKRAVRAGLGVSVVLRSSVEDEVAAGQLRALPIESKSASKSFYLVHRADVEEASLTSKVAHTLSQHYQSIVY